MMGEQSEHEILQEKCEYQTGRCDDRKYRHGANIGKSLDGSTKQPKAVKWKILEADWDMNNVSEKDGRKEDPFHKDQSHYSNARNPKNPQHCAHHIEIDLFDEVEDDTYIFKQNAIIARVVGPKFPRKDIRSWLDENWGNQVIIKFLLKGFFVAVFAEAKEKDHILQLQNWFMENHPLYVQSWAPNFDPTPLAVYDNLVWVRLFNLPTKY
ncbi:hypothetical protein SUGI_0910360 [Cryptomeria japonica]|nr:hypothetical protein SUGI_0910360 [Cryptomeria japonica]